MTRRKVTTTGVNGDLVFARKSNRKNVDIEGRLRKKEKKRKGLKTGSRHSQGAEGDFVKSNQHGDPRLGSKKKVPLIVDAPKKQTKQERRLSAEQELIQLENDAQLQVLLGRLENGEKLGAGLQKYVDEKLDRIEQLMQQLGLLEEMDTQAPDDDDQPDTSDFSGLSDEDELLQQFTDLDTDKL
ncbi:Der GTPase-activating protein YihI [Vibrio aerogenes CECT 7868]|uniref:Der GTPase-activating protein YihI n=1 Tax=Vibrio aerogenes CECT 7868 TaxID=1216006 RepID=A0A1M5ZF28_9VIBR|nr:Der GTPase-activating protein YihI [Vibrio aerogenes]SHI22846.1 Der GTPase-activating protein YihI [Vibrio aerogenes CECT 7868]